MLIDLDVNTIHTDWKLPTLHCLYAEIWWSDYETVKDESGSSSVLTEAE